jgi:UDP-N-acetylmuramate--alanine ligase
VSAFDNTGFFEGFNPTLSASGSTFVEKGVTFNVPLPGRHNAENALHAIRLCEKLGFELRKIAGALAAFQGIHRRLEKVGEARGVTVIDDYAHNPAKIQAAWQAVRQGSPQAAAPYRKRVLAVWRPHGFKPLAVMMDELVHVISGLCEKDDRFYVLPVYDAGGTADRNIRSEMLVEKLKARNVPAEMAGDPEALATVLAAAARSGDAIMTLGARDPGLPALARRILAALRDS